MKISNLRDFKDKEDENDIKNILSQTKQKEKQIWITSMVSWKSSC